MSERKDTTISIAKTTWKKLSALKEVGESMNDVVVRLIKEHEESKSG